MKRATITLAGVLLLIAGMARADLHGSWTATRDKSEAGKIHLQLRHNPSNNGHTMSLADFTGLTAAQLASAANHGVTLDFVEELAELGYRDLAADDLVAFRIHGVTAEFIRELEADGERDLTPDDLVSIKIRGGR